MTPELGLLMQVWQKETNPNRPWCWIMNRFYKDLTFEDVDFLKECRIMPYGDKRI